jgi:hypothetical protein
MRASSKRSSSISAAPSKPASIPISLACQRATPTVGNGPVPVVLEAANFEFLALGLQVSQFN